MSLIKNFLQKIRTLRKKKTAIVWLTHFHDPEGQKAFAKLAEEASDFGTVFQARDRMDPPDGNPEPHLINLSNEDVSSACPYRLNGLNEILSKGEISDGYTDIVEMAIAKRLPEFSYIWVIEMDVDFTGHWGEFFREFENCKADLLGARIRSFGENREWSHWPSFIAPKSLDSKNQYNGFFPVVRFSRRFIRNYLQEVSRGWEGHFEALYPSIALHKGLVVEDFGGTGTMVPKTRSKKWYTGSSFHFRPPVASRYFPDSDGDLPKSQLCHPVKTEAWHAQHISSGIKKP